MIPNATINVSVSNHYRKPSYESEITSQGILGERVEIVQSGPLFSKILQADEYVSWISSDQIVEGEYCNGKTILATSHFLRLFREPTTDSQGIRDAVIGCTVETIDETEEWYKIALPDGHTGWAEKAHFGSFPESTPQNIVASAHQFLGYQYFWGGRTPKGFDCSGFVQTVFRLHEILLPRDTWQQQELNVISDDFRDAEPADLLFFAKTPERVTHVAIALGGGKFIHASGRVKNNSLMKSDTDFSSKHLKTFVSVNRCPKRERG